MTTIEESASPRVGIRVGRRRIHRRERRRPRRAIAKAAAEEGLAAPFTISGSAVRTVQLSHDVLRLFR